MKIQYCSDLHLEFPENKSYLDKHPIQPEGEILLLGGDILPFSIDHRNFEFFNYVSNNFEAVYWIPGNHEYYGYDIGKISSSLFEKIRHNVFLVNNHSIVYKEVNIICSTLWSHINPINEWMVQRNLTDFSNILMNGNPLLPANFNALHQIALNYLIIDLKKFPTEKNIVLTHHVPTLINYPPKYKKSKLNEGFAVELNDLIISSNISYWLYGHHHKNIPAFTIGNTTLLTNQLGYIRKHEHGGYKKNAVFEI